MSNMQDRWDLGYLYAGFDDESFRGDLGSLKADGDALRALLSDESLTEAKKLEKLVLSTEKLSDKLSRLWLFVSCTLAVDATNAEANKADDQLSTIYTTLEPVFSAITRFTAGMKDLEGAIAGSEYLGRCAFALLEMKDQAKHLIPDTIEPWILEMQLSGGNAFSQLRDKLDSTVSVDYRDEKLPLAGVRGKAYDPDPQVRRDAYDADIAAYSKIELPMSYCLNSIKMEARTLAKARGFDSVLDMTLDSSRMDRETLDALWTAVREFLPDFRRYLKAKAGILGHENGLPFWDLFAPVGNAAKKFTIEEARETLIREMGKFTPKMAEFIDHAFSARWIDALRLSGCRGCRSAMPICRAIRACS